jgi:hypothetical protein
MNCDEQIANLRVSTSAKSGSMAEQNHTATLEQRNIRRRVVMPSNLSEAERAELVERLYSVHKRIFSGVSVEEFRSHVVEPPAETTVIQTYAMRDGEFVGYCAFHCFRREVRGQNAIVLRAEAGLIPEFRGRGATYAFGMMHAAAEMLRHPFTPVYYLGTLVHPSSYHLFCKYFPKLFPHPGYTTSQDLKDVAYKLIQSFPDPPVTADDPFIRDVGWVTIETPQEQALTAACDRRDLQFFRKRNPGYPKGHGLVVVVPITFANITVALLIRLHERALIALGRHKPEL